MQSRGRQLSPSWRPFFALVKMFQVSGTSPPERLGLDDHRVAKSRRLSLSLSKAVARHIFLFGFAIHPLGIVVLDRSGRRLGCFGKPV